MESSMRTCWFGFAVAGVLASTCVAQGTQIFFGAVDTISGRDMHRPDPLAYMDFFKPDAPWQRSASRVNVFEVSTQFILSSTDEQLTTVFDDMKRRGIADGRCAAGAWVRSGGGTPACERGRHCGQASNKAWLQARRDGDG